MNDTLHRLVNEEKAGSGSRQRVSGCWCIGPFGGTSHRIHLSWQQSGLQ